MATILVYNQDTNRIERYNRGSNEAMPYVTGNTLTVKEFRGSSGSDIIWTTKAFMEAWNSLRRQWGKPIYVGYAFKRIWQGGHSGMSQHYAGLAMDMAQTFSNSERNRLRDLAIDSRLFTYVEPKALTPTWVGLLLEKKFNITYLNIYYYCVIIYEVIKLEELIKLSPQEFYKYIKNNIHYGFVDKTEKKYYSDDFEKVDIDSLYILQSPKQVIKNKCAWCWDVVELLRYYLDAKNLYNETYYIEYRNDKLKIHNTHTFIIFSQNSKWYNIEDNSSSNETGVFEYNSKEEVIATISGSFKSWIKEIYNLSDLSSGYILNQYSKPRYGITAEEFQNHCKKRK